MPSSNIVYASCVYLDLCWVRCFGWLGKVTIFGQHQHHLVRFRIESTSLAVVLRALSCLLIRRAFVQVLHKIYVAYERVGYTKPSARTMWSVYYYYHVMIHLFALNGTALNASERRIVKVTKARNAKTRACIDAAGHRCPCSAAARPKWVVCNSVYFRRGEYFANTKTRLTRPQSTDNIPKHILLVGVPLGDAVELLMCPMVARSCWAAAGQSTSSALHNGHLSHDLAQHRAGGSENMIRRTLARQPGRTSSTWSVRIQEQKHTHTRSHRIQFAIECENRHHRLARLVKHRFNPTRSPSDLKQHMASGWNLKLSEHNVYKRAFIGELWCQVWVKISAQYTDRHIHICMKEHTQCRSAN